MIKLLLKYPRTIYAGAIMLNLGVAAFVIYAFLN
jgi:hypothetical protein